MKYIIHMLSKDARRRIIELLVREYGASEAAAILGVSKPAVTKYIHHRTHPSDRTMSKILDAVDEDIMNEILSIIGEELVHAINDYRELIADAHANKRLEVILEELRDAIKKLDEVIEEKTS